LAVGQTLTVSAGNVSNARVCTTPGLIAPMAAARQLADMTDADAATGLAVTYQLISQYTHCLAIAVHQTSWVLMPANLFLGRSSF